MKQQPTRYNGYEPLEAVHQHGTFTGASLLSRGLRFFAEAALLWYAGPPIRTFVERNLAVLTTVFFVLLLGRFALLTYVL